MSRYGQCWITGQTEDLLKILEHETAKVTSTATQITAEKQLDPLPRSPHISGTLSGSRAGMFMPQSRM
jgi:hypothetical protein